METNVEPKAGEPKEPQQSDTVSTEQFNELLTKFESVHKAQQGSDKKVQELLEQLSAKDNEIELAKKAAETANMDKVDVLSNQLKEMNDKLVAAENKTAHEKFLSEGYKLATSMNVSTSLVDHYGGKPEGLADFLTGVKEDIEARETKIKNELLAGGYKPSAGGPGETPEAWDYSKHSKQENEQHDIAETESYYKKLETTA